MQVRLEGRTDFCWLCENPQKLVVPFEMRGYQGVYNLERRIYDGAVRGLTPIQGPLPVKFPLPDPRDGFSLKPGSLTFIDAPKSALQKSPSVTAAIAGARAAATQFSNKDHNAAATSTSHVREQCSGNGNLLPSTAQGQGSTAAYSQNPDAESLRRPRLEYGSELPSNRLVAVALRELKQLSVSERGGGQPVGRS
ncbi:hypothetical protein PVAP13_9KG024400 [Panicum virgatum]|uniref:Uncharacterized protein n=2 Tax=Panicum virgatum TaxID=38727 RepID=A0A8T0N862_PANVG|nr:hypothetical protein PVAP13_9KG024400 [Panicum virgatum]